MNDEMNAEINDEMNAMLDTPLEIETAPNPVYSVIWLHGLGADGRDFEDVVPALGISALTPMRFVLPDAPVRAITINDGMKMRGWYDITGMDFEHGQDRQGIEHSAGIVGALIARENDRGIPPENIFLAGFSQGGATVLHAGLRFPKQLAGIIALSAYLPLADSLEAEKSTANQSTPIFMAHGVHDPLIPVALARRGKQQLRQSGYAVLWRKYPLQHGVSAQEIADLAVFLHDSVISRQ